MVDGGLRKRSPQKVRKEIGDCDEIEKLENFCSLFLILNVRTTVVITE